MEKKIVQEEKSLQNKGWALEEHKKIPQNTPRSVSSIFEKRRCCPRECVQESIILIYFTERKVQLIKVRRRKASDRAWKMIGKILKD